MARSRRGPAPVSPIVPHRRAPRLDPWGAAVLLCVLVLAAHAAGAPFGEPVADDFDFLHRQLFRGFGTFFDGGGSQTFWRPLPHQVYYHLLGPLILARPGAVAILHGLLIALASWLLFRAFRQGLPAPIAAAAAAFPWLQESGRSFLTWPSHFVELGLLLFSGLALHQASRRRLVTAQLALLAALLCKEPAVVTAALLPWLPGQGVDRATRLRWVIASAATVAVWALTYFVVHRSAGLTLPHDLGTNPELLATPLSRRLGWAMANSARATMSLSLEPGAVDRLVGIGLLALGAAAATLLVADRASRARLKTALPWICWGGLWFLLASSVLAAVFPIWQPNRSAFGAIGLGVAAAAALGSIRPVLLAGLLALQLAAFALNPDPSPRIDFYAPGKGAFVDFERLVRLQRLMRATRLALREKFPVLPTRARVVFLHLPRMSSYAFGGGRALQVWYRDTTLHTLSASDFSDHPQTEVVTVVQFQEDPVRPVVLIDPEPVRRYLAAGVALGQDRAADALAELQRAAGRAPARGHVFQSMIGARRALCFAILQRGGAAEIESRRALALWRDNPEAHLTLGLIWGDRGWFEAAEAQLDSVMQFDPTYPGASRVRDYVRRLRLNPLPPGADSMATPASTLRLPDRRDRAEAPPRVPTIALGKPSAS
jgi:hypothetical protein